MTARGKIFLLVLVLSTLGGPFEKIGIAETPEEPQFGKIADAIFIAEGGKKAKVPYGILSVAVKDADEARKICLTTLQRTWVRYREHRQREFYQGCYIDFLADRYCPPSVDPQGNLNWKKNVKQILLTKGYSIQ